MSAKEPSVASSCGSLRDPLLALLAWEPSHGYQLCARPQRALGPLAPALNARHVYVTLNRREGGGPVTAARVSQAYRPDRKVYELTAAARAETGLA